MLVEELLRCQIQEWYPTFRRHTIPTVLIPLPAAFLRYLSGQHAYPNPDADSDEEPLPFLLPAVASGRQPFAPVHAHLPDPVSQLDRLNSDLFFGSGDDDVYDPDAEHPFSPEFPELEAAVDAAITELGGAALPKLNWSAPKDATFMSADGTIRCTCFSEVALLLRSSDCVTHDLVSARPSCEDFVRPGGARQNDRADSAGAEEGARPNALESSGNEGVQPNGRESSDVALGDCEETTEEASKQIASNCDDKNAPEHDVQQGSNSENWVDDGFQYYLALRKWYPGLRPESEFRCFVREKRLVSVSQRDASAYYPSLPGWSAEVQPKIEAFFEEVIQPQFASDNYTFDVYVRADGRVKLIDFNPWGGYTLPLLFTWEELEEKEGDQELEFRVVMQQGAVRPGLMTAVPYDMLDWGEGSGWDAFLKKADEELNRQMNSMEGDS
ncbi:hypothetical protein PR202_ga23719 [Eleusine coracana subsp. coracana]|uniref:Cell division cycle protein 123 n=1 Tax=Eleusine coracana subsp. coracana TaxID=191504 RepID=A0AAV5D6Y1_ELECO|nr:hypothetical protein QOZ80_1AG0006940 [Eleusine coracana subsp. coracana]GJN06034.1 hypothetical protein PR202_ga23719 [Eleusine coracana subsp. coracana]